jgi:transcriptional regulator with XRE-family HTH domain
MDEIAFGRAIRAIRVRKRLTQDALGARAGVSRSAIARIEQGHASRVTIASLDRVAGAMGARVLVKLLWQAEGLDRLLDSRHATTVEEVIRVLGSTGWQVATEVSFSEYGERGSIDVLAFQPEARALLVVEVKTAIGDAQELQSTLDRKVRLAATIARRRRWEGASVSTLLVMVDSRTNRTTVGRLAVTFGGAFPDRNVAVRRWLAEPEPDRPLRGLWFLNIGTEAVVTQRVRRRRVRARHEDSTQR